MIRGYTDEKNALILISLMKKHGIKRVIASPGTMNMGLIGSLQYDKDFVIFSSADERSAAYMACGMAEECHEPIVISCTGATASRNYLPGLTEAYYRKLPIIAITSTYPSWRVGHNNQQMIDRSVCPADIAIKSIQIPMINDEESRWAVETMINDAFLSMREEGGDFEGRSI